MRPISRPGSGSADSGSRPLGLAAFVAVPRLRSSAARLKVLPMSPCRSLSSRCRSRHTRCLAAARLVRGGGALRGSLPARPRCWRRTRPRRNFAWPIQPVVVAALFGAIYFCALLLMLAGAFTRIWERVARHRSAVRGLHRRDAAADRFCTGIDSRPSRFRLRSGSPATCCRRRSLSRATSGNRSARNRSASASPSPCRLCPHVPVRERRGAYRSFRSS